jgi:hypothetical protein
MMGVTLGVMCGALLCDDALMAATSTCLLGEKKRGHHTSPTVNDTTID